MSMTIQAMANVLKSWAFNNLLPPIVHMHSLAQSADAHDLRHVRPPAQFCETSLEPKATQAAHAPLAQASCRYGSGTDQRAPKQAMRAQTSNNMYSSELL